MTPDDSDARLSSETRPRNSNARAVDAYKLIAQTANLAERVEVAKLLLPLDASAAADILTSAVADLVAASEGAPPAPTSTGSDPFLQNLLNLTASLAQALPEAAIAIYTQIVASPFPFSYRIAAAAQIAELDGSQ